MIRRPPRSTQSRSSAASDVYKRQVSIMWNQTIESNIPINEVSLFREIIHSGTFFEYCCETIFNRTQGSGTRRFQEMIAGTRFSARVILFSAISGLVLTNLNYLSAEDTSVEINSIPRSSTRTVRNPQSTLKNAIQREMHSARRNPTLPRVRFPQTEQQTEQQPAQIQQTGFTLNPKALFQKKSSEPEQKRQIIVNSAAQSTAPQYKTAVPVPDAKPGQSEIQRQLEALYRRDGRQMPPMSMDALPKTANTAGSGRGTVNTTPAPQQTPAATAKATPAPQQSAPQNSAHRNVIVAPQQSVAQESEEKKKWYEMFLPCLLYTSPSPRDRTRSRMPSSA
eukprot:TRINITY_DN2519_c0_g1_i1.p1 TRINITY_DN2519_c0_g1~~TRINITY_DN2519_c0_g1_i1.p1  ORF type:complete len:337 (-),score=23.18 TRINITY_DN2519_c0_g1_i1:101-1111(-)